MTPHASFLRPLSQHVPTEGTTHSPHLAATRRKLSTQAPKQRSPSSTFLEMRLGAAATAQKHQDPAAQHLPDPDPEQGPDAACREETLIQPPEKTPPARAFPWACSHTSLLPVCAVRGATGSQQQTLTGDQAKSENTTGPLQTPPPTWTRTSSAHRVTPSERVLTV